MLRKAVATALAICVMAQAGLASESAGATAQSASLVAAEDARAARGQVTNLPLPRYVSLKAAKANVRRGPSLSHRIDWVFQRRHMPLRVTAEHEHWRRVEDREGFGGWVHYSLISGSRTVLVIEDDLNLRARPDGTTQATAKLKQNVVAQLGKCGPDWCRVRAGGFRGWAPKTALWGVRADELRN